ncbi:MAG: tetratricopeptide repeat protein [Pseudomonadales bacterium]|nr:tetratricopeptide repeat protein [Pseudomonadales bacterium]
MLINSLKSIALPLFVTMSLIACSGGEDRQAKYLERAKTYLEQENYDKARIEARNVLQINPKNAAARQVLGEINFVDGDIRKAYGNFLSVLDLEPENIDANIAMARIYVGVRDYPKGLEHCDTVLAVEPENTEAMNFKALLLTANGDEEQGQIIAEQALAIDPGLTEALGVVVQKLFSTEDFDQALKILERGQAFNPKETRITSMKISLLESMDRQEDVEAELKKLSNQYPDEQRYATTLARYYIREGEIDAAETALRTFSEINEEEVSAKLAIISFLLQQRTKEDAVAEAQALIKDEPDQSDFYLALSELHLFTGDVENGRKVLNTLIDRDPRSVGAINARNVLVDTFLKEEDKESAMGLLDEVLDIEPENISALLKRAQLVLLDGKAKEGIADLRVVLKNEPDSIIALKLLAGAQELEGRVDLALDNMKKVIALEDPVLESLANAARIALALEQYKEAEDFIRQALKLDEDNTSLVSNLIKLLVLKEDYDSAKNFADQLIASDTSKALGYFLKANLELRLEEFSAAIANLKKSLESEPKGVESLTALSSLITQEQGVEKALSFVGDHCKQYSKQAHCHYILGSLYAQNQQLDNAIVSIEQAISLNDQLQPAYRQLAKIHGFRRDIDAVVEVLRRGYDNTNQPSLAFDLASFYYQVQDYQAASEIYEELIAENAKLLSAINNLAMIYAQQLNSPENLKRALALTADLQDSENPAFLDTVGWIFYLTGDYERALTYVQAAVDKIGNAGELQYHLGMIFLKLGDIESGKTHLRFAVEDENARYNGFDIAEATLAELQAEG